MGLFLDTSYMVECDKYKSGRQIIIKLMIKIEPEEEKSEIMHEREKSESRNEREKSEREKSEYTQERERVEGRKEKRNQEKGKYSFTVSYEYRGERSAEAIQKAFFKNFVLPCWFQQTSAEEQNLKGDLPLHHSVSSECFNGKSAVQCVISDFKVDIMDSRIFRRKSHEEDYKMILEDQKYLKECESFEYTEEQKKQDQKYSRQTNLSTEQHQKRKLSIKRIELFKSVENWKYFKDSRLDSIKKFQFLISREKNISNEEFKEERYQKVIYFKINKQPYFLISSRARFKGYRKMKQYNLFVGQKQGTQYFFEVDVIAKEENKLDLQKQMFYNQLEQNQNVKNLNFDIKIMDRDHFFQEKKYSFKDKKISIEPVSTRNRIRLHYYEPILRNNRIYLKKNFHLAFQGGGAKGLAYVGAYKAIKQYKAFSENKEVPITSIMGSSAGGIIALAISTGIPEYELQKICYKMGDIPFEDRYQRKIIETQIDNEKKALEDKGQQINQKRNKLEKSKQKVLEEKDKQQRERQKRKDELIETFKKILHSYGILQESSFDRLHKYLKDDYMDVIEEKLVKVVEAVSPAMSDIFKKQQPPYEINKKIENESLASKMKGWMFGRGHSSAYKQKLNLFGLLQEGALMKGQTIYNIAAECIMKYFFKLKYQATSSQELKKNLSSEQKRKEKKEIEQKEYQKEEPQFKQLLDECLRINPEDTKISKKNSKYCHSDRIWKGLDDLTASGFNLLTLNINTLFEQFQKIDEKDKNMNQQKDKKDPKLSSFTIFMTAIVNKVMILLDNFFSQVEDRKGLILGEKYPKIIFLNRQKYGEISFLDYFRGLQIERQQLARTKKQILKEIPYRQLNSEHNFTHLIDPQQINPKTILGNYSKETLLYFLNDVFGNQILFLNLQTNFSKYFRKNNCRMNIHELFYSLEAPEVIYETYKLIKKKFKRKQMQKLFQQIQSQTLRPFQQYTKNFQSLRDEIAKIDMRQYYRINNIELSCTSVDLDDKILRFFNHKTTPQLPVCRAVQMTGSFPVAFKAQKWKKEWGYYNIYHIHSKIQVDLEDHQFTDGGLLANFPIKYMDNDEMRRKYFSHDTIKQKTVLLGFGLDYLETNRYQPTQKQQIASKIMKSKAQIAINDLIESFNKISVAIKFWKISSSNERQTVNWSQIPQNLVQDIPLLRFLLKLLSAYPNSDRNLNIQAFQSRIFTQNLEPHWINPQQNQAAKQIERRRFLQYFMHQYRKDYDQPQHIEEKLLQKAQSDLVNGIYQSQRALKTSFQMNQPQENFTISQVIQKKKQELKERLKFMKDGYYSIIKRRKNTLQSQKEMSLIMIHILMFHLKNENNKQKARQYSRYFTFFKYIIKNQKRQNLFKDQQWQNEISTSKPIGIEKPLTRLKYKNLFKKRQIGQISSHLDLYGYKSDFYSRYTEKEALDINNQRNCCNSCCNTCNSFCSCFSACCSCCTCSNCMEANRQKELRESVYTKRKSKQFFSDFQDQERQKLINETDQNFINNSFNEQQLSDITDSIRRLTQFLYLFIKGRDENKKLKKPQELAILYNIVNKVNFQVLIDFHSQQNHGKIKCIKNEVIKYNKNANIQFDPSQYILTFKDIICFLFEETTSNNKICMELFLQKYIKEMFKSYNPPNNEQQKKKEKKQIQTIFSSFFKKLIGMSYKSSKEDKKNSFVAFQHVNYGFKNWEERQMNFMLKKKNFSLLMREFKKQIVQLMNKQSQALSKLIYSILNKQKSFEEIQNLSKTISGRKQLQQIKSFLLFIVNKQEDRKKSIEKSQKLLRDKDEALSSLLFLFLQQNNMDLINFYFSKNTLQVIKNQIRNSYSQIEKKRKEILTEDNPSIEKPQNSQFYTEIDMQMLKLCDLFSIRHHISQRLGSSSFEKQKKDRLILLDKCYNQDFQFLLYSLKQIEFLSSQIDLSKIDDNWKKKFEDMEKIRWQKQRQENYKEVKVSEKYKFQTIVIFCVKSFLQTKETIDFLKDGQQNKQDNDYIHPSTNMLKEVITKIYENIFEEFISKYKRLSYLVTNQINQIALQQAFVIKLEYTYILIHNVYKTIKMIQIYKELYRIKAESQEMKGMLKRFQYIFDVFQVLLHHKSSLPLFHIDASICSSFIHPDIANKAEEILKYQSPNDKRGVHLFFQGVSNSNQYFGGLYSNITNTLVSLWKQNAPQIKAITCSNFHSVFGFLHSLNKSTEEIRIEMLKLKHIANTLEDQKIAKNHFDKLEWIKNKEYGYKEYLKYLEQEHESLFEKIQTLAKKDYKQHSISQQFVNVKLLYMHQKESLMRTYQNILDEASENFQQIKKNNIPYHYGLQISKKYGIDYQCKLDHNHQYSHYSKQSRQMFKYLAQSLINTFQCLVTGILSNYIAEQNVISVNKQNASFVVKGIFISRLLTVFKLKEYIINHLKAERLSPSISLSQFYKVSKKKILLNFTTINVNQQRLAFINKSITPNMPVWAAILATSSLPLFHEYFVANKEWEAPDSESFYEFYVKDFFNAFHDKKERITRYTSGNMISSLPLDLLLNNTIQQKFFKDADHQDLNQFAICFQKTKRNYAVDIPVKKQYINITCGSYWQMAKKYFSGKMRDISRGLRRTLSCLNCRNPHDNDKYVIDYSAVSALIDFGNKGSFTESLNILVNSNDNFTLKWYYNKLIRLPIKIGTLDFDQIVDVPVLKQFGVSLPSQKCTQAIERSYEITKSFIHNIFERNEQKQIILAEKERKKNKIRQSQFSEQQIKRLKQRFLVKFRVQVVDKYHPKTGFQYKFLKLQFINHTQWNQNYYNNFAIQYWIDTKEEQEPSQYKKVEDSQVLWPIEENSSIYLKFFYSIKRTEMYKNEKAENKKEEIWDTKCQLQFSDIIEELPKKNSYNFEFVFGWKKKLKPKNSVILQNYHLRPTKVNGFDLKLANQRQNYPKIDLVFHQLEMLVENQLQPSSIDLNPQRLGQKMDNNGFMKTSLIKTTSLQSPKPRLRKDL